MNLRLARSLAFWSAHIAFGLLILLLILGDAFFPGYSQLRDFISELGAREAPTEWWVRFGAFLPMGLIMMSFPFAASRALPRSKNLVIGMIGIFLFALGYAIAAFLPCDPGCLPEEPSVTQLIHNLTAVFAYLPAPIYLALLGVAARTWPRAGATPWVIFAGAMATLIGVLGLDPEIAYVGLSQRLVEGGVWASVLACAWYIRRHGETRQE